MNLSDQVCSLDLAKRLKELGVKQNAYQAWVENTPDGSFHLWNEEIRAMRYMGPKFDRRRKEPQEYSAYSVAELGELLPLIYGTWQDSKGVWFCKKISEGEGTPFTQEGTEADARAEMLIYLIENKLIEV